VLAAVEELRSRFAGWSIVHQTGRHDAAGVAGAYRRCGIDAEVAPFFTDMAVRYASATLVISRAGATTLAELACAGCPAILLPYPGSVGDHQLHNARACEAAGAACVVEENNRAGAPGTALARTLDTLVGDRLARDEMARGMRSLGRPNAAKTVADEILHIVRRRAARPETLPARSAVERSTPPAAARQPRP
jgi:UDP-N-acetylglucosamine--N-acetylmuramyl-(pentapeptide) pyrophosphoryl-undecaprenol N-acetylglucosamine transferase